MPDSPAGPQRGAVDQANPDRRTAAAQGGLTQQLFRQWVQAPVPRPREVRLLFLLKLYFARTFGAATVRTLIARQIEACTAFLTRLQEGRPSLSAAGGLAVNTSAVLQDFRGIIHQARLRQIEATISWLTALQGQAEAIALAPPREKSAQPI